MTVLTGYFQDIGAQIRCGGDEKWKSNLEWTLLFWSVCIFSIKALVEYDQRASLSGVFGFSLWWAKFCLPCLVALASS